MTLTQMLLDDVYYSVDIKLRRIGPFEIRKQSIDPGVFLVASDYELSDYFVQQDLRGDLFSCHVVKQ